MAPNAQPQSPHGPQRPKVVPGRLKSEEGTTTADGCGPESAAPNNNIFHNNGVLATIHCQWCHHAGCDVRLVRCRCSFHARCCPVSANRPIQRCPVCPPPGPGEDDDDDTTMALPLHLLAMTFEEIDFAKQQAIRSSVEQLNNTNGKRGRKRKSATIARLTGGAVAATMMMASIGNSGGGDLHGGSSAAALSSSASVGGGGGGGIGSTATSTTSELRTGRWTDEETEYCDALIVLFELGKLPIPDGIKLNEFLANMLKSKQSRLTKKMKNARLSTKQYQRTTGHIADANEAMTFSKIETKFVASIKCPMERAEIRFHMQKEWREHFSNYCVLVHQPLDANAWLSSVEELDRRASVQKDTERTVRRKVMMGHALNFDATNCHSRGVYIEGGQEQQQEPLKTTREDHNPMQHYAAPFIAKVLEIMKRHHFPFEHVDAWVPSFLQMGGDQQGNGAGDGGSNNNNNNSAAAPCRLCFAGCGTTKYKIQPGHHGEGAAAVKLGDDEEFHLLSFGEYSQKFSFDVGSGLPGRVYSSGVASWEQGIQNAPLAKFERCGGASQWGIQTVLGIPIPSPSVGRIVVVFYSIHDRVRQLELVQAIAEDLNKLRPSPKWKLVVDVGKDATNDPDDAEADGLTSLLRIIETHTPSDKSSPRAGFLPGFTALRLLLQKKKRSQRENDLLKCVLACYESYKTTGRSEADTACMTARDYMALDKESSITSQVDQHTYSTTGDIAPHTVPSTNPSWSGTAMTSTTSTAAMVNVAQIQPQQQQQTFNNGFSALDMAISLAQSGATVWPTAQMTDTTSAHHHPASLALSLGAFVGQQLHGTSPALHPISSHDAGNNMMPITGNLAALVHHDSWHQQPSRPANKN